MGEWLEQLDPQSRCGWSSQEPGHQEEDEVGGGHTLQPGVTDHLRGGHHADIADIAITQLEIGFESNYVIVKQALASKKTFRFWTSPDHHLTFS